VARTNARCKPGAVAVRRQQLLRVCHPPAAARLDDEAGARLARAGMTAAILRCLRPRFAGIAVADVDAAQGEGPLDVRQVPQGRFGSRFVVAQEVKEDPGDEELALRAFLRDFSVRRPRGGGRPGRPETPAGGSTTSGSTNFGVQKACVCPIASASTRSAASGWPSVPSARSGPMWCGPSTSPSTRPQTGGTSIS
jgi:hypothetical protein